MKVYGLGQVSIYNSHFECLSSEEGGVLNLLL